MLPATILIRDLQRDWRRWSRSERVAAMLVMSFLTLAPAAAIATAIHP